MPSAMRRSHRPKPLLQTMPTPPVCLGRGRERHRRRPYLADQEQAQARALEEARLAEDLALRKYTTSGTLTIFNLIDAQTRRLTAESQLISVSANRATNRISYHLALGGGLPVLTASTATTPTEAAAE
jgi:multidrug efflux system outer membrane protein